MRTLLLASLVSLFATLGVRADPRGDARAVLDAAIAAHGGKEALKKVATCERHGGGQLILPGGRQQFTDSVLTRLPGKLRIALEIERRVQIVMVANDTKGWKAAGGTTVELTGDGLAELQEEAYVLWLTTLVPLHGTEFTLTPVGDAERDGKKVVGVQVASKGHADATLWFDRTSKLLLLIEKEAKVGGMKVRKTYGYSDHKEFDGVKLPTRLFEKIGEQVVTQVSVVDYRFPRSILDAFFAKP